MTRVIFQSAWLQRLMSLYWYISGYLGCHHYANCHGHLFGLVGAFGKYQYIYYYYYNFAWRVIHNSAYDALRLELHSELWGNSSPSTMPTCHIIYIGT